MKKSLLAFLVTTTICFGQTKYDIHDSLISVANTYKYDGNFKKAIEEYRTALELLTPNSSTSYFDLASCALQMDNENLANEWIRKGVTQGGGQWNISEAYEGFEHIQDKRFYKDFLVDYNSLRQKYFSTLENIDIYLEIEELTARDQFVRKIDDYISGRTDEDSEMP